MKHIVVAVTNDLVTDQRVGRTCQALTEAGYKVTLVGRRLPDSPPMDARDYPTERMRLWFRRSALFYAEYNIRLLCKLLRTRADAFYANDSDTLPACCMAARLRHKKLVFDAHELFPDVPELVGKTTVRKVWREVERRCVPRADAAITVCHSVAEEYRKRYGKEMAVVRNFGPRTPAEAEDEAPYEAPQGTKTILYQGAVNVGRGVRELVDAMEWLPQCHLVVAGGGDELETLRDYAQGVAWHERIHFLGRVEPRRLHALTRRADMGVCLLEDLGLNYRYALPNRIADFAQAGVPVLATDFCEIRHVIEQYRTGALTEPCPHTKEGEAYKAYVRRLARTVETSLAHWQAMPEADRQALFARARQELCWENEKKTLIETIDTIFQQKKR